METIIRLMHNRIFLTLLLISNFLGSIYGYWWYGGQLAQTKWYFYPFVPDSPTATLFLSILIVLILAGKKWGLIDALAFTRSEEHTSELQSRGHLVCRLL